MAADISTLRSMADSQPDQVRYEQIWTKSFAKAFAPEFTKKNSSLKKNLHIQLKLLSYVTYV